MKTPLSPLTRERSEWSGPGWTGAARRVGPGQTEGTDHTPRNERNSLSHRLCYKAPTLAACNHHPPALSPAIPDNPAGLFLFGNGMSHILLANWRSSSPTASRYTAVVVGEAWPSQR